MLQCHVHWVPFNRSKTRSRKIYTAAVCLGARCCCLHTGLNLGAEFWKKSSLRKARAAKCFCHALVSSQSAPAVESRVSVKGQRQVLCTSVSCSVGTRQEHGLGPNPSGWFAGLHESDNTNFTLGEFGGAKYLPGALVWDCVLRTLTEQLKVLPGAFETRGRGSFPCS